jgi:hypothetical protein
VVCVVVAGEETIEYAVVLTEGVHERSTVVVDEATAVKFVTASGGDIVTDDDVTEPPDPKLLTDVTTNVYVVFSVKPVNEYEV